MSTVIKHLTPEVPAHRLKVVFDYEHSEPLIAAGSRVICGDRANELRAVRDAADGAIAAIKRGSREGLCTSASGVLLCTRRAGHEPPCICAAVQVVALDIWIEE